MMETLVKAAGVCLAASVMALLLKRDAPELGLLLAVAGVLAVGALVLDAAREAAEFGGTLAALTGLSPALFMPLVKVIAIAAVSRVCSAVCTDAGQKALAYVMETAGAFCALGCAVPLLEAVVDLLRGWI